MFKTRTEYTKELFKDFANYTIRKNKYIIWIYVCSAIIIASAIIMLALKETEEDIMDGVIFLIIGVFFAFYGVLMRFIIYLQNKKNVGTVDDYEFENDKIIVNSTNKEGKNICSLSINYDALYKCVIYKNYAYIYPNKLMAYIILKQNFPSEEQFNQVVTNIQNKIVKGK